jgi:NTP pyrophosphatase (non-canonical NTP hydrolase)
MSYADKIAEVDAWLDGGVSETYADQPLGQHWARVAKASEEVGEAIEKLIEWTGQNPRKPQRDEARGEMLDELADVAITAILAMQHFTKDADETLRLFDDRFEFLYRRMRAKILEVAVTDGC